MENYKELIDEYIDNMKIGSVFIDYELLELLGLDEYDCSDKALMYISELSSVESFLKGYKNIYIKKGSGYYVDLESLGFAISRSSGFKSQLSLPKLCNIFGLSSQVPAKTVILNPVADFYINVNNNNIISFKYSDDISDMSHGKWDLPVLIDRCLDYINYEGDKESKRKNIITGIYNGGW